MRRKVADVQGDHVRHRVITRQPIPDFGQVHSELLREAPLPIGSAPEFALQLCCSHESLQWELGVGR